MVPGTSRTVVDFEDRGRRGRVVVTCQPDLDPERWGYPLLGLPSPVDAARGFPVLQASVETAAEGYASILGWVQVVRIRRPDHPRLELVDVAPQLQGLDVPYLAFGPRPALFDAPSTDARDDRDWIAHTYLVSTPDCVMTRRLTPLCGLTWGYRIAQEQPSTITPSEIDRDAWVEDRRLLQGEHPSWVFGAWPG